MSAVLISTIGPEGRQSLATLELAIAPLHGMAFGKAVCASRNDGATLVFAIPEGVGNAFIRLGIERNTGEIAPGLHLSVADEVKMESLTWSGEGAESNGGIWSSNTVPDLPDAWAAALHVRARPLASYIPARQDIER